MLQNSRGLVQCCNGAALVISRKNKLFISYDYGETWSFEISIPIPSINQLKGMTVITSRLFRQKIDHVAWVDKDCMVVLGYGSIYSVDLNGSSVRSVAPVYGKRPLSLCDAPEGLYYGEYRDNSERSTIHVWGSSDKGVSWNPVWHFDSVRHVHGVFYDSYTDAIWVTTGDTDSESALWRTTDNFQSLECVLHGSQQYRAVQLLFSAEYVYWGSDTPLEKNYLYRFERTSGRVERIHAVEGSVFWGGEVNGRLFFSTAVEPSDVNNCNCSCVWGSQDGSAWTCVARFNKDRWPKKLFQYGQTFFPSGHNDSDYLWITPFATEQHETLQKMDVREIFNNAI
ncbi:hypothetical protein [Desulfoluna butyratoxydans]|uniref:Uncharacterized protein n=1 Tax=Desulfoluna butyratoxydans TaxID=231438 RepID=A0A4U8YU91_9BACT|nr:hypothetical protein [Desulfoluna butyratoxydans]VFQ47464.1 hypothetical protein MSL71_51640 [Desulfoluna butyratoxydans]